MRGIDRVDKIWRESSALLAAIYREMICVTRQDDVLQTCFNLVPVDNIKKILTTR